MATMRLRCYTQRERERERETKKGKDEEVESYDVHCEASRSNAAWIRSRPSYLVRLSGHLDTTN